jgi:hypothetical protein
MTRAQFIKRFPNASKETIALTYPNETNPGTRLPDPKPERHQAPALGAAISGETKGVSRTRVRVVGHRVRPLDPDNFAGSVKDLLDGLRHAGLLEGDEPWRIILETEQVKVRRLKAQKTVIEIFRDEPRRCSKCGLPLKAHEAQAWLNASAGFCEDCTMTT